MSEKNRIGYDLFDEDGEKRDATQYPFLKESVNWIRTAMPFFTLARGSVETHRRLLQDGEALVHHGIDRVAFSDGQEIREVGQQLAGWRKRYDRILDSGGDNAGGERITLAPRDALLTNLTFDRPLNRTRYPNVLAAKAYPEIAEFGNEDLNAHEIHTVLYLALFETLCTRPQEVCNDILRAVPRMIDVIVPDENMNAAVKAELQKEMIPIDENRWLHWFRQLMRNDQ